MTVEMPKWLKSKNIIVVEDGKHKLRSETMLIGLKESASDSEKENFENEMNKYIKPVAELVFPEMKDPYYKWTGEVVDKARMDDDDDDESSGGSHGNTKIPFGLCQREGIKVGADWTPKDAWNALEGKGYKAGDVYQNLRQTGKAGKPSGASSGSAETSKPDRKAMRERARSAYEAKNREAENAEKEFDKAWSEYITMRDMQDVYDEVVKRKKERLSKCEDINGRSVEELEAARNKLETRIQENNDNIRKANKRPKPGTPEREEWDKWYSQIGKKRSIDYMKEQNGWLEAEKKELDGLIEYKNNDPDGADIGKAREAYESALKKSDDHKRATQEKYDLSSQMRDRIPAIEKEQKQERQKALKEIRDSFSSYDDCESTQDIADRLSGGGYFRNGGEADFEGVDLETARSAAKSVEKLFEDFPALKGRLGELKVDRERALSLFGDAAYAGSELNGPVFLNADKWKSAEDLQRDIDGDVEKKFHPPGTTPVSLVMHEYTHQIDDLLSKNLSQLTGGVWTRGKLCDAIQYEVSKRLDIPYPEMIGSVSAYAEHNPQEWLAEACSEYFTSKNPRPVAQETGKVLLEYLQKYQEIAGMHHDGDGTASEKVVAFRVRREMRLRKRYGKNYDSIMGYKRRRSSRIDAKNG